MQLAPQILVLASALSILPTTTAVSVQTVNSVLHDAHLSNGTQIFYPTDANYRSETIQRYTIHDAPTYVASVKPATIDDVEKIVQAALAHAIPFLATGGGHGFTTTYDKLDQGLQIDMHNFNQIDIDKQSSTLTVGPGVIFGEVFQPVFEAGYEVVTGSSICVGMIGATIGGGVGRYNGIHGMIVDTLLSVDMITANGTRLTASKTENCDLFWAIRGAGANFGIIVAATYQLFPLTSPTVMNWDLAFPLNASEPIMEWFAGIQAQNDPKLVPILMTQYNESMYGGLGLLINVVYIGSKQEGSKYVQPLLNKTGTPIRSNLSEPTFADLATVNFFGTEVGSCVKNVNSNVYGGSVQTYDVASFDQFYKDLNKFLHDNPSTQDSIFFIEHFGNAAALALPEDSTSYPWRNITAHLLYNYIYNDTSLDSTVDQFAVAQRETLQKSSGFQTEQVYVGYGHGDEGTAVWYGSFTPRLADLKTKWDPHDIFSFNNPVPQAAKQ